MLESSKYTSGVGIGGLATTLIGLVVSTGIITPEQGSILSLHIVPIIGGVIAVIGAFTVWHTPAATPPLIERAADFSKTPDTTKRDPFNNR